MAKRTLEDVLAGALRERETGEPANAQQAAGIDPTPWLRLRDRLEPSTRLNASMHGRDRGRRRMLAALAAPPHAGGLQMMMSLFAMVPKAAALVVGGVVLTGSAVGASAAVGGPNLPVAALTAIGLHAEARNSGGIGNAPDAAQTGKEHAGDQATTGSGNAQASATATASGTVTAGINHAPDAAQTGKDHANERAFLGSGNASATVTAGLGVGVGIGNAPDAAQTGKEHANERASVGAAVTTTADVVIGIDHAAQSGIDHAAAIASLGAGIGSTVTITPAAGLANAPEAAQVGTGHATNATASVGTQRP